MSQKISAKIFVTTSLLYFFLLSIFMLLFVFVWPTFDNVTNFVDDVYSLLDSNEMSEFKKLCKDKGISQLALINEMGELPELPPHDELRLRQASFTLQQKLILRQWLVKSNMINYYTKLLSFNVNRLEDVYWFEDSKATKVFNKDKDFKVWSRARQSLPTKKNDLEMIKSDLWSEVVKNSCHQDAWTWEGMLIVSLSMAGLVTLAAMTQPSLAPEAKHTLLQYVTGKYLMPSNCKVVFHWDDMHPVGQTVCFTVHFYQRNGNPYPISDGDKLKVKVTDSNNKKMALITELGSATDPQQCNLAKIKFTVRHANLYVISVMVGGKHVAGSPFSRTFVPGPVDAQRTLLFRYFSTIVCTANVGHVLYIEPRDEYNNVCNFKPGQDRTQGFDISIVGTDIGRNDEDEEYDDQRYIKHRTSLDYDSETKRMTVQIKFYEEGVYRACVTYNKQLIKNGKLDVIVLNSVDSSLVHKNVMSKNQIVHYEAKILKCNGERLAKPKRVLCYVSPKQFIIKEMFLKFIPKRLYTFRLCPSTKFNFSNSNEEEEMENCFQVDDGCQPKIYLSSKDRNVIAASFVQFLLKNVGGSETFRDKRDFFYHEVRRHHRNKRHNKVTLRISRSQLLETSMRATKGFSVQDWCKNFEIVFDGEPGIDWGGIRREWFELVCTRLFDSKNNEFFKSFHDGEQALVHPNPNRSSNNIKLKHYEFAGKIAGKCLYESALGGNYRQLVKAKFTRSFLAQIIGLRVHYKYFEQDDPDLYLTKIKFILDNNIDETDIEMYFVEEIYDDFGQLKRTVELIPNGARVRVRDSTKMQYLDALAQFRLSTSVREEIDAFMKGLNELIPDNLLSIFDENELELLLCGTGQYSINDFKANHLINGNSPEFKKIVGWFWAAISNYTQEEMARLLQFTTGCSQLPSGGFKELSPKFQITAAPTFGNLPTAHTCFNQLCLPDYESYEQFEKALLLAINEGTEGFGMV